MQTYYVVVDTREGEPDVEVSARKYADVKCLCCKRRVNEWDHNARLDAAYNDGLALGTLLRERGAGEFERGLFIGLGLRPR